MNTCELTHAGQPCNQPATMHDLRCPHCRTHITIAACDWPHQIKCAACGNLSGLGRWAGK